MGVNLLQSVPVELSILLFSSPISLKAQAVTANQRLSESKDLH